MSSAISFVKTDVYLQLMNIKENDVCNSCKEHVYFTGMAQLLTHLTDSYVRRLPRK